MQEVSAAAARCATNRVPATALFQRLMERTRPVGNRRGCAVKPHRPCLHSAWPPASPHRRHETPASELSPHTANSAAPAQGLPTDVNATFAPARTCWSPHRVTMRLRPRARSNGLFFQVAGYDRHGFAAHREVA